MIKYCDRKNEILIDSTTMTHTILKMSIYFHCYKFSTRSIIYHLTHATMHSLSIFYTGQIVVLVLDVEDEEVLERLGRERGRGLS